MINARIEMQPEGGWVLKCTECEHQEYCSTMSEVNQSFRRHVTQFHLPAGRLEDEWPEVIE